MRVSGNRILFKAVMFVKSEGFALKKCVLYGFATIIIFNDTFPSYLRFSIEYFQIFAIISISVFFVILVTLRPSV